MFIFGIALPLAYLQQYSLVLKILPCVCHVIMQSLSFYVFILIPLVWDFFFFSLFFPFFERQRNMRGLPFTDFLPKWPQWPEQNQSESGSKELALCPPGAQGLEPPSISSHGPYARTGLEVVQPENELMPMFDAGASCRGLAFFNAVPSHILFLNCMHWSVMEVMCPILTVCLVCRHSSHWAQGHLMTICSFFLFVRWCNLYRYR